MEGTPYTSKDRNAKEGYKTTLKRAMGHIKDTGEFVNKPKKSKGEALKKAKK